MTPTPRRGSRGGVAAPHPSRRLLVSQINIEPGDVRDAGMGSVLALLLLLVLVAVLVWALVLGGLQRVGGGPAVAPAASSAPASQSGTTINVEPTINVRPAPSGDAPGTTPSKP
jgi:hypothetical protein